MKTFLLLATFNFALLTFNCFAQQNKIDSLLTLLKKDKPDTNKVKHLNALGWLLMYQNPDTAIILGNQALAIITPVSSSEFISEKEGMEDNGIRTHRANTLGNLGAYYHLKADYLRALDYYLKALKYDKGLKNKKRILARLGNIGNVYSCQADYPKSLNYYLEALKIAEELKDKNSIAILFGNIGVVYHKQKDYSKTLEYYLKALKIEEELKNKDGIARHIGNIGLSYREQGDYPKALGYFLKALKIEEELKNKNGIARHIGNIGGVYFEQKDYFKALNHFLKALKIAEEIGDKHGIAAWLSNIGELYTKTGNFKEAEKYLKRAIVIDDSIGTLDFLRQAEESLSHLYDTIGQYQLALIHYKKAMALKDTLFNEQTSKQIADMGAKYETEKKDKDILLKEKELQIQGLKVSRMTYYILILMILVMLISFTAYLILRKNKHKALYKNIKLEQKLLQSQMSPHFIFNSLSAIQNFIFQNKNNAAIEYLTRLAKLTRMILENSRQEYITLDKETNILELYLELQSARFKNRFNYLIETDPGLLPEMIAIPPMLAQPFIENSIEHGIQHKEETGTIKIIFKEENDMLLFEVIDDGVGREKAQELSVQNNTGKKHVSLATRITEERLGNINKSRKRKDKIKLTIIDLKDTNGNASGTMVKFYIPFIAV